jgi:VanZ family protein
MRGHRSSAAPLAWLYAALIAYASLYPFAGWHVGGMAPLVFLAQPASHWWSGFDLVSNLFGYVPLGALLFVAQVRSAVGLAPALAFAVGWGAGLSLLMELLQNFLPGRVPSNVDLALNVFGTLLGAAAGGAIHLLGWVDRWQSVRERWFIPGCAGGLALILLWPVGLLFPTPMPLGLGQVLGPLQAGLVDLLAGTSAQPWAETWLLADPGAVGLSPVGESAAVTLGLLSPCLVAFAITVPGWRRLALVLGAAALGTATTTLSTALNFGPEHALAWITPAALAALALGSGLALLLALLPRRMAAGLGLVLLTALAALVAQAPEDPYFAQSLQAWEQGRFIRFHGAAQWVGWLWPYAAMAYLLARLGSRDEP